MFFFCFEVSKYVSYLQRLPINLIKFYDFAYKYSYIISSSL